MFEAQELWAQDGEGSAFMILSRLLADYLKLCKPVRSVNDKKMPGKLKLNE